MEIQSSSLAWYYKNKKRILADKKEYYLDNKETINKKTSEYRKNNSEKIKEYNKKWRQKNKGMLNAKNQKRRLVKKHRTPLWLTATDFERIENEYKLATILTALTGQNWEVDHIIPLQGKFVSGLHVPSNLRAIPAFDNRRKHNQYDQVAK